MKIRPITVNQWRDLFPAKLSGCYSVPFMRISAALLLVGMLCLAGCGTPGAPLPPSLNIPQPVRDLKAVRKGDSATLTWTAPQNTTDGALLKHSGKMTLRRSLFNIGAKVFASTAVAEFPLKPALKQQSQQLTYKDSMTSLLQPATAADFAVYTVEAVNDSGRGAGPSNQAMAPLVPVPATPQGLDLKVVPAGVSISWGQRWPPVNNTHLDAQYIYRIMRRQEGSKDVALVAELSAGNQTAVIDTRIDWEKKYQYWVIPVTQWQGGGEKGEVEGDDSPVVEIEAHDVFPPAAPSGLQAVFSGVTQQPFIDLTWTPNTEPDLAGYNVYRHTEGTQPIKLNQDLVKTPAFRDSAVQPGTKYFYSVSAVDLRNNESPKSEEASEVVPM